jgi:glycosyltransferase involved in cell wall biosynthesis
MSKKVLRIVNRFNLGGPTFNAAYLTKYLAPEFETLLIGGEKTKTEESSEFILQQLGVNYQKIEAMSREISLLNDYKAYKEIKQIIRDFKPDIIHTHASKAGLLGRLAAKHSGVKVIVHTFHGHVFHSYFGALKTNIFKSLERYLARKSKVIIAISNKQKYELAVEHKIAPESKFRVIPLGFDLSRFTNITEKQRQSFRQKYNITDEQITITIVGRLVPIKDHKLFIDSIKQLKTKTKKQIRVFIVGGGELYTELINYTKNIGLTVSENNDIADINFTSWIKKTEWVYAGSDVVALSSLNEGTPVSLIEAQACGKPIVSTKVGGVEDIVIDGKTAVLCSNTVDSFTNAMLEIIENYPQYLKNSQENINLVSEKFSYNRLVADVRKLYNEII